MHHQLDGHEFEQGPGAGDGQGSLTCCSLWGHKKSDTTEQQQIWKGSKGRSQGRSVVPWKATLFEEAIIDASRKGRLTHPAFSLLVKASLPPLSTALYPFFPIKSLFWKFLMEQFSSGCMAILWCVKLVSFNYISQDSLPIHSQLQQARERHFCEIWRTDVGETAAIS